MTPASNLALGLVLGLLGGGAHLAVARLRAGLLPRRGAPLVLALYPVGLLGPALAVLCAARIHAVSAIAVPFGILLIRTLVLGRGTRSR